jgi:hypothetical protein
MADTLDLSSTNKLRVPIFLDYKQFGYISLSTGASIRRYEHLADDLKQEIAEILAKMRIYLHAPVVQTLQ